MADSTKKRPQDPSPEAPAAAAAEAAPPLSNESAGTDKRGDDDNNNNEETTSGITRPQNPLLQATWISKLLFQWPYPLMKVGMQRSIEESDLPQIVETETSAVNLNMMERIWGEEQQRAAGRQQKNKNKSGKKKGSAVAHPSLHRAILKNFLTDIWYVQPLMLASSAAKIVQALALGLLIETFELVDEERPNQGYIWAAVLVLCGAVIVFEHHHVFFMTWRKGMQLRTACVAAVYAKTLRLKSTAGVDAVSSGRVMNIASNDVERFLVAALFGSYLFWAPLQSLAILGLGIKMIGPAFAAGYGLLVCVFVPLQFYLSKRFAVLRSKVAAITDLRVTLVSQAVSGVRVMKMSGWEEQFEERIAAIRAKEVRQIQKANRLRALNEAVFFSANVVISIVIFMVHVAMGGYLTPRSVFTTMTLINVVQIEMTKHLSLAVMGVSECYVSISRIQKFFEFSEISSPVAECPVTRDGIASTDRPYLVSVSNVTCFWNGNREQLEDLVTTEDSSSSKGLGIIPKGMIVALEDINLELGAGELTCVVGVVGSGKSALIQALAGELEVASGTIERRYSSLSYAAQDPWIMDGTVKENIIMGKEFDDEWYGSVVGACGLSVDFEQLRNGDRTIVGDRGVQCSGGQRARIGLARALYRDSDVLLLDDPLSAVDSKVGRLIFYSAILGLAVKRGKCVVLATHQHQFVGESKCVLVTNGRIACVGSYSECVGASDGKLTKSIHNAEDQSAEDGRLSTAEEPIGAKSTAIETEIVNSEDAEDAKDSVMSTVKSSNDHQASKDHEETKAQGVVQKDTYRTYANAMGGLAIAAFLFVLFSVTQASVLVAIAAVGTWSERPPEEQKSSSSWAIVLGLGAVVIALSLIRAFGSFGLTIKASRVLHDKMTASVLRGKIEFFDTNPLGRILNRFSADVGSNDDLLPTTLFDFWMCAFLCLGALVTAIVVLPFTLIAVPPLLLYFIWVRRIFVTTTRELKRLEGLARSPIYSMLTESLGGIATIRSNGALQYFKDKFETVHDAHSRAFFAFISSSRWVGFRMDSLMFMFISVASFLAVLFNTQSWFTIDPAVLGLALTMLLQLSGLFQWAVRQSAEVVNLMVSVERVNEFGHLSPEAALELDTDASSSPMEGSVEVKDLSVRYRASLPLSLRNISFKIESGERVGVVGRTGSGKSTLVQALFRLLEAEEGKIFVDGVDISTLGLHKLRTSMSVIPQFPVLFSGCTVRENLDPFQAYTEECIQDALTDVHMIDAIGELSGGLDSIVAEGGSNFSVGQRQLLCLARAILKKNRILVLDEATANVDARTDKLLQEAVSKSFAGATIIAVAHRLDTVIDYDKILVLGAGEILAYGTPHELASVEGGHFASMVDDTGHSMAFELRRRASRASLTDGPE